MKTTTPSRSASARRFVSVAAIIIATTLNITAAEAEKNAPEPTDPHLVELPELVVTARRIEEHPLDVPAYTNVITREQIEKSGASNLIELLKSQANLSFTSLSSSPTNTKVSMRGTGNGDNNGRALILIDGIRANRPDMGSFNWLQFAVQDIESIEVIQGPQGGYYGDNAVGGVIKINTRGAPNKSGGQVSALVGSNATVKTSGSYTQAVGNAWTTVSAGHDESEGYRNHSDYMADSGALRFGYDNKKNSATQVGVSYIATEFEQPEGLTKAQFAADPTQDGGNFSDGWSKTYRVTGSSQFGGKDESTLLSDIAYFNTNEYADQRSWQSVYNREIQGGSVSPKVVVEFNDFNLTPGLDLNYDQLVSHVDSTSVFSPAYSFGQLDRWVAGPYLGGEYAASERIGFSGVWRHEFNKMTADTFNTNSPSNKHFSRTEEGDAYQLAVNFRPEKGLRVYAKYDHTYRFPSTDEVTYYQGFSGGPFLTPVFFNPALRPEQSDNFEVGGDFTKGYWVLGGAVYHMQTNNEVFYNSATNLNENIDLTERNGFQAHFGYDNCVIGFRSRVDYVSAQVRENSITNAQQSGQLPMVPVWQTTESVFFRPATGMLFEFTHRFAGGSDSTFSSTTTNMIRLPATNMFDVKVAYQLTEKWSASAGINNLTDRKSISGAFASSGSGSIYPGEGRFMYLGSTYKF